MNTNENIKEEITTAVNAVTVDIPLRVTMTSVNDAPFEFTASIDEVGQIVLTPVTTDVEFVTANTTNTEASDELINSEEVVTRDGTFNFVTEEITIVIQGNMLAETDNHDVSAFVDEIGQVILTPAQNNTFVSAAIGDSVNLVTEETSTDSDDNIPEVTAEVIDEEISNIEDTYDESSDEIIEATIESITANYTETEGAILCDTIHEGSASFDLLTQKYTDVTVSFKDDKIRIDYKNNLSVEESQSEDDKDTSEELTAEER